MVYGDEPGEPDDESSQRVLIGGSDDCDHESLRRVGSDGDYNIYFECSDCDGSIVKFSETDASAGQRHNELSEMDLPEEPPTEKRTHPLIKGLTPNEQNGHGRADEGVLERMGSSLRALFGDDRKK